MAKKILLFLSLLNPPTAAAGPMDYCCPDGGIVTGVQTNEAPVKYLLRQDPEIAQILCVCSPESLTPQGTLTVSAWAHFTEEITAAGFSRDAILALDGDGSFEAEVLPRVMENICPGDEIYLETTGGLRNDVMRMLLITRVLSYTGVKVIGAVYSNFSIRPKTIEDITQMVRVFDLVEGMQNMASFGNVKQLRGYYGKPAKDPDIEALIDAMEKLFEAISLCRGSKINSCSKRLARALNQASNCGDPLMRQLIPAFRAKFMRGESNKLSTPDLIAWCLDSDMLQQALTLYTERVPAYLVERKILSIDKDKLAKIPVKNKISHQDETAAIFDEILLRLSDKSDDFAVCASRKKNSPYAASIEHLSRLLPGSPFTFSRTVQQIQPILRDYIYLKMVRNMTNHAASGNIQKQQRQERYLCGFDYRPRRTYPALDTLTAAQMRDVLSASLARLTV